MAQDVPKVGLVLSSGGAKGMAHIGVLKVLEELGIGQNTIGIAPVGCSVLAYDFMNIDMQQAAHGRAPALATGIKRTWPDKIVFTYQGDGDLAAIGSRRSQWLQYPTDPCAPGPR